MPAATPPKIRAAISTVVRAARTPRAGRPGSTARCPAPASACGRTGHRAHRGRAPRPRGRVSSRPPIMLRDVCEESNASPIDGSATFATARLRLATAAPRISAVRTRGARSGRRSALAGVVPASDGASNVRPLHPFVVRCLVPVPCSRALFPCPAWSRQAWLFIAPRHRTTTGRGSASYASGDAVARRAADPDHLQIPLAGGCDRPDRGSNVRRHGNGP